MPRDIADVREANRPFTQSVGQSADLTVQQNQNALRNLAGMAEDVEDFNLLVDALGLRDAVNDLRRRRS